MILKKAAKPAALVLLTLLVFASVILLWLPERSFKKPIGLAFENDDLFSENTEKEDFNLWTALSGLDQSTGETRIDVPPQKEIYDALCAQFEEMDSEGILPPVDIHDPDSFSLRMIRYEQTGRPGDAYFDLWEITARFSDQEVLVYMEAKTHAVLESHIHFLVPISYEQTCNLKGYLWYLDRIFPARGDCGTEFSAYAYQNVYEISLFLSMIDQEAGVNKAILFIREDQFFA